MAHAVTPERNKVGKQPRCSARLSTMDHVSAENRPVVKIGEDGEDGGFEVETVFSLKN